MPRKPKPPTDVTDNVVPISDGARSRVTKSDERVTTKVAKNPTTRAHGRKGNSTTRYGDWVSAGDGWGGPAKGLGSPVKDIRAHGPRAPRLKSALRKEERAHRARVLEDELFRLSQEAEREETRVSAAAKLHAIYEGQPIGRQITYSTDDLGELSDDQIAEELAKLG
jgi:hypothetical protein